MAAGLGFIEFSTGDVLSAAAANGYLASQTVMVFASAAARTSAIASPQEGMVSFLKDTDALQYYTGSVWSNVDTTSGGMTLLNSGGTALSGASTSISITTTGYTSLAIYLKDVYGSVNAEQVFMRINGDTGSNYSYSGVRNDGGVSAVNALASTSIPYIVYQVPSSSTPMRNGNAMVNIFQPTATDNFYVNWQSYGFSNTSTSGNVVGGAVYDASAAITSLLFGIGSGTFSGGTAYIYGVK